MIIIDPLYAYFLLTIPFAVIWAILFLFGNSETKKEQITMSFVGLILGPVTEILYFTDYWAPQSIFSFNIGAHPILLEDLLFGFLFFGVVAVLYTSFSRKTLQHDYNFQHLVQLLIFSALTTGLAVTLWFIGFNSIFATTVGFITLTALALFARFDLYKCALWSGVLTSGMLFIIYFVGLNFVSNSDSVLSEIWLLSNTDLGLRVLGVPLSELMWGFGAGTTIGVVYKVAFGKRIYAKKTGSNPSTTSSAWLRGRPVL